MKKDLKNNQLFKEFTTEEEAKSWAEENYGQCLKAIEPPNELYHGTATRFSENICKEGIKKQNRQYVHLSADIETATKVGKRHGELIIFKINSEKMYQDGYKFFLSENKVWLTDYVPIKYFSKEK